MAFSSKVDREKASSGLFRGIFDEFEVARRDLLRGDSPWKKEHASLVERILREEKTPQTPRVLPLWSGFLAALPNLSYVTEILEPRRVPFPRSRKRRQSVSASLFLSL